MAAAQPFALQVFHRRSLTRYYQDAKAKALQTLADFSDVFLAREDPNLHDRATLIRTGNRFWH